MKRIFVSHPLYSEGSIPENFMAAEDICLEIIEQGDIPISPLHLFSHVQDETPELRVEILEVCKRMIEMCDEVWSYGNQGGCALEKTWAQQCSIPVVDRRGE